MRELHLFAGAGGGILGGILCGHTTVCAVEIDPYCRKVLLQRQRDGVLPVFPIWDDVRTFDGTPWRGRVDVVCLGFPCQDISVAGKGAGIDGEKSGLWGEGARIIGEVQPRFVFVENSPALLTARKEDAVLVEVVGSLFGRRRDRTYIEVLKSPNALRVLGDLAAMGYDCRWGVVSAEDACWLGGTPAIDHLRERVWIVAQSRNSDDLPHRTQRGVQERPTANATRDCGDKDNQHAYSGSSESEQRCDTDLQWRRPAEAEQARVGCCGNAVGVDTSRIQQGRQEQRAERERDQTSGESVAASSDALCTGCEELHDAAIAIKERFDTGIPDSRRNSWWLAEPDVGRVAHGVASRVVRLKAIGNGQVPAVAALAWDLLCGPVVNH